ncbi:contractile injection system tape measure protein [Chryseobacterium sp. MYb264]|uniref:contractile injection system tape measure protein n=1 Tax=Chryseobacterium sp. MYb264 TaxID=2745153 RepID=UPI002E13FF02|nr:contractile injection system tape measure protein [Chryseobacterium sp. MYb264]
MKSDHIIQKVFVEITVNNKEKAYQIKDNISSFLSADVFPEIEKYINSLEHTLAGRTLQIPHLEFNLDVKSSSLNTELKEKIAELFKEELSEIIRPLETLDHEGEKDAKAYLVGNQEKLVQTFIYFLETGSMPWWNSEKKGIDFLEPTVFEMLLLTPSLQKSLISILPKQNVRDRIIYQLPDRQIAQLCRIILENKEAEINLESVIISRISKMSSDKRIFIWQFVLNLLSEYLATSKNNLREYLLQQVSTASLAGLSTLKGNHKQWKTVVEIFPFITENEILENIEKIHESIENIKNNAIPIHENSEKSVKKIIQDHPFAQENTVQNNGQYVQNTGLILIHPFMKTFFEHCDLWNAKNQELIDPERCTHLLHYIATGKTNAAEYDMLFEKFLCNIPLNQTINRHIKLSRKHKAQAKNVIESVQHNWAPMKKSSPALLQNEFFQRPGKLVTTDYDYTLTVERKTQDILLDKLGWGIGLVKLPWKEKFMLVNW